MSTDTWQQRFERFQQDLQRRLIAAAQAVEGGAQPEATSFLVCTLPLLRLLGFEATEPDSFLAMARPVSASQHGRAAKGQDFTDGLLRYPNGNQVLIETKRILPSKEHLLSHAPQLDRQLKQFLTKVGILTDGRFLAVVVQDLAVNAPLKHREVLVVDLLKITRIDLHKLEHLARLKFKSSFWTTLGDSKERREAALYPIKFAKVSSVLLDGLSNTFPEVPLGEHVRSAIRKEGMSFRDDPEAYSDYWRKLAGGLMVKNQGFRFDQDETRRLMSTPADWKNLIHGQRPGTFSNKVGFAFERYASRTLASLPTPPPMPPPA